ncbi:MAG: DNA polymerase III subunit alpha, partial [Candidatus Omnitrophica bacterium]|nr:DNA polymerase III subunit alpha [Candidatus Omnitrophota bacterium]
QSMGFTSYFLIVWDFIHYAKSKNIPVGPGRGSAAGSLVSYLLGITDINPLKYGLIFERFLNPDRIGLPDIDIDFCYERRPEVIDYVTKKYGRENVAQIITFGTMQARAVVRDVGRVMGIAYADVDRIAKMIPPDPNISLKDALTNEIELNTLYKTDSQITELLNTALSLEGLNRHASIHAAGVVIADKPLDNYSPLFKTGDDQITTGYSMSALDKIGLLKMDFLGLRTLTVIEETLKIIKQTKGVSLDIEIIPLDDRNTYKLLSSAHTIGVFQVESSGMRDLLRKLEPARFEDLIALLALYRPGPIGSGMLDDFIKRKHGLIPVKYEHPKLENILRETYGIMVYQEQIMQIASALAGFTLAQADVLRKAMGKKIPEVMEKQRKNFILGCTKNEIKESTSAKIFDLVEYFSGYGFNKCVAGSTEIVDAENGKISSVAELFEDRSKTDCTFSCSDNLKITKTKIKDIVYNGIKPVYKLRTALGREIIATSNHPFFTIFGWKNLGDLKIGERVGLCRLLPFEGTASLKQHEIIVLAGVISEGNTCHPSGIYFYNNEKILIDDFVENLTKFNNTCAKITRRRGRFEVYAGTGRDFKFIKNGVPWNKGLAKENYASCIKTISQQRCGARLWIEELGLDYKKAPEKFIPPEIFSLPKQSLALFIGRLWSGDGFIFSKNNSIPFYATSSLKLCRQLQDLLLRFGIASRLATKTFNYRHRNKKQLKTGYALYLFGYNSMDNFSQEICPFIIGRAKQIENLKLYYKKVQKNLESKDTLPPEVKEIIKEEKKKSGLTWDELEKRSGVCMKEFYGRPKFHKKGFRRQTILQLAHFFESERLLRLIKADILWDRIVSVDYIGREKTYDLEIENIHNFIANGFIVHNSHSAAYALISYRTAYLKANYPVEFMTALLTSERDNTDKIVEYVAEANRMGIEILPPDINESQALFKVVDNKTIRYGLLAVKNVGSGAIESVLAERKNDKFTSLENLCSKIDLRLVNKKVLESLIKCGALDSFKMPRAQMVASLEKMLEHSSRTQKERSTGQLSFFDSGMPQNAFRDTKIDLPQVKEWPEPQILAFEKDMLGFYVSGHPLARYAGQLKRFTSTSTANLNMHKDEEEIKLVGLIAKIKQTLTRAKQEKMAILKLEDLQGIVEALVFPKTYQKISRYILPSTVVMIRGILNLKEDTPKIIVNDMVPMDAVYKMISGININLTGLQENLFISLKELLLAHSGQIPVYLHLDTPAKSKVQLVVGEGLFVNPSEKLIQDIIDLLGEDKLTLTV